MNRIFLLGGYDLEMFEIKNILGKHNEKYIDKNLKWGARLSAYSEDLENLSSFDEIYGIELIDDIKDTNHKVKLIDHHNENVDKPAAIEQVCEILGIQMTRDQKLIAINDTSYIDGMKNFGASEDEIKVIRRMDRMCQGVTEEDERLGEKSILENLETINNNIIIVKSLTNKFSTICDRLYPTTHLIIYNSNELNYYGHASKDIYEKYFHEYKENIYYGSGYFGFSEGILNEKEILNKVGEISNYVSESNY